MTPNPAARLEQLEEAIFRLHVHCFPRIEYINSETTLGHLKSILMTEAEREN